MGITKKNNIVDLFKKHGLVIGLILNAGCIGFIAGSYFYEGNKSNSSEKTQEMRLGGYTFINPLLECDNFQSSNILSSVELETKVNDVIEKAKLTGLVSHVSFYYRDLSNGPWIGIGEKDDFSPASLLKVPIMIALFKKSEEDPDFLNKKIKYESRLDEFSPNILDSTIQMGKTYSVLELIRYLIVHSDNEARLLLLQNIDIGFVNQVYADIGIDISQFSDGQDYMSVKTYSSFFRLLYNATYLNKKNSEKALQILSKSAFKKGLTAQLPADVIVSHKFGERGYPGSDIKQLHDCGIVYKGKSPYLICVMTKGTNLEEQAKIIAEISLLVYNHN